MSVSIDNVNATSVTLSTTGRFIDYKQVKVYYYFPHNHEYSYSAAGDTLTVTCGNTDGMCTLPNCIAALTLSAADAEWSGSAYTGADTNVADFNSSTGLSAAAAITYEGVDGTIYASSETAPTAVGSYKAVAAVTGLDEAYTLEQTFAITKAAPVKTDPTAASLTYNLEA